MEVRFRYHNLCFKFYARIPYNSLNKREKYIEIGSWLKSKVTAIETLIWNP